MKVVYRAHGLERLKSKAVLGLLVALCVEKVGHLVTKSTGEMAKVCFAGQGGKFGKWWLGTSGIDQMEEYCPEGQRKQGGDLVMKSWVSGERENAVAYRQEYESGGGRCPKLVELQSLKKRYK